MVLMAATSVPLEVPPRSPLAGFLAKRIWNGRVWWPPEANLLILRDSDSRNTVVLVTVDAVYANEISRLLRTRFLDSCHLLVAPSHTHYVPSAMPEFPGLGAQAPGYCAAAAEHIGNAVVELEATLHEGDLRYHGAVAHSVASRRRATLRSKPEWPFVRRGIAMLPAHGGPIDATARCWSVEGLDRPVFIWTVPCHPTAFFDREALTSEYVGYVREALRMASREDAVVLFFQGPSGDLRPPFTSYDPRRVGLPTLLMSLIPRLEPPFATPEPGEWYEWAGRLAQGVVRRASAPRSHPASEVGAAPMRVRQAIPRAVIEPAGQHPKLAVTAYHLHPELTVVAVNAEVTDALAVAMRGRWAGATTITATCVDECIGYLATRQEMRAGGYEGGAWLAEFGCDGEVVMSAPDMLLSMCDEISDKAR
jgi:hypothetical protein